MRTNERLLNISTSIFRASVLTMALTVGALLASARTAHAQEPVGPTDPGVRCAAKVGPGQYEFYLPGEKATDVNGNKWVCGPDGQWFRDYSSLTLGGSTGGIRVTTTYVVASARYAARLY